MAWAAGYVCIASGALMLLRPTPYRYRGAVDEVERGKNRTKLVEWIDRFTATTRCSTGQIRVQTLADPFEICPEGIILRNEPWPISVRLLREQEKTKTGRPAVVA